MRHSTALESQSRSFPGVVESLYLSLSLKDGETINLLPTFNLNFSPTFVFTTYVLSSVTHKPKQKQKKISSMPLMTRLQCVRLPESLCKCQAADYVPRSNVPLGLQTLHHG